MSIARILTSAEQNSPSSLIWALIGHVLSILHDNRLFHSFTFLFLFLLCFLGRFFSGGGGGGQHRSRVLSLFSKAKEKVLGTRLSGRGCTFFFFSILVFITFWCFTLLIVKYKGRKTSPHLKLNYLPRTSCHFYSNSPPWQIVIMAHSCYHASHCRVQFPREFNSLLLFYPTANCVNKLRYCQRIKQLGMCSTYSRWCCATCLK